MAVRKYRPINYPTGAASSVAWGSITGTLADQTDLQAALDAKAATSHTHVIADVTDFTDNSANWDTAFGWGDHSTAGYLTSIPATEQYLVTDTKAAANEDNWLLENELGTFKLSTSTDAAPNTIATTAFSISRVSTTPGTCTVNVATDFTGDVDIVGSLTASAPTFTTSALFRGNTTWTAPDLDGRAAMYAQNSYAEGRLRLYNGANWGLLLKGLGNTPQIGSYGGAGGSLSIVAFGDTTATTLNTAVGSNSDGILAKFDYPNNQVDIFGSLTATSYGGITEANLVDKAANEAISGEWSVPSIARNKTADYTAVLGDAGQTIRGTSGTLTFTIPANGSVAYPVGTMLGFVNNTGNAMTIAITTDTLRFADDNTTGSRTIANGGIAVALKTTTTEWTIAGKQVT